MAEEKGWRNRIVERRRMRVGDLLANKFNPRTHPTAQQQRTRAVLDKFGVVGGLIAWRSERENGELVLFDGHLRRSLDPDQEWDILVTDLSDEEVDELVFYFDEVTGMAMHDSATVTALLEGLNVEDELLKGMLDEMADEAGLILPEPPDDFPEFDDDIDTDYCCPRCGYSWSGAPR
jgi:hypothetical protein